MKLHNIAAACVATFILASGAPTKAGPIQVDTELALLVDVSGSVDNSEFRLQRDGIKAAFLDPAVRSVISNGPLGQIAVTVVLWSSDWRQIQAVDWTLINDASSATAFANNVGQLSNPILGIMTAPGNAIDFITNSDPQSGRSSTSFQENNFDGTRSVIDVSGDGKRNDGISTSGARDAALNIWGVDQINGLVIGNSQTVLDFYNTEVKGGNGAFVINAASFDDFATAFKTKLIMEITPPDSSFPPQNSPPPMSHMPEPSSMVLLSIGLIGMAGGAARRRKVSSKRRENL